VVLGFELRALARQVLYYLNHIFSPVCFSYFSNSVQHFCVRSASDWNPPTNASCIARTTGVHHHAQLVGWGGGSLTFCLCWPQTMILLTSTSRVTGITVMSHSSVFWAYLQASKKAMQVYLGEAVCWRTLILATCQVLFWEHSLVLNISIRRIALWVGNYPYSYLSDEEIETQRS
jgi:hypothetical protein